MSWPRRGHRRGHGAVVHGVGNAAHLGLLRHSEDVDKDREVLVELWAGWCEARRSGKRVRARRSSRRQWGAVVPLLRLRRRKKEAKK